MPRKKADDESLILATTAAVASILGNLTQAIENSDLKSQATTLRVERAQLVQAMRRWRQSYETQSIKLAETQVGLQRAREQVTQLQEKVLQLDQRITELDVARSSARLDHKRAAMKCATKDREIAKLRERITALAKPRKDGSSK